MVRILSIGLLMATALTLTEAIPAFTPAKTERSNFGLAPVRRSKQRPKDIVRARMLYEQQLAAQTKAVASKYPVDYLSNVSDYSMWEQFQDTGKLPEPIRGKTGATSIGPENPTLDRQNPDSYAPPNSDSGTGEH